MPSTTHVEVRTGAVIHTDDAGIDVASIDGASYFVTYIDEFSRHLWAFTMKPKVEAAELLNCQVS